VDVGVAHQHEAENDLPLGVGLLQVLVAPGLGSGQAVPDHLKVEGADGREGGSNLGGDVVGVDDQTVATAE
jgi:hypothetical protein